MKYQNTNLMQLSKKRNETNCQIRQIQVKQQQMAIKIKLNEWKIGKTIKRNNKQYLPSQSLLESMLRIQQKKLIDIIVMCVHI